MKRKEEIRYSVYGENVHSMEGMPKNEYPRPMMVREDFRCLNGWWEYAITESESVEVYDGKILVPFSPESDLSGVAKCVGPKDVLHYRKVFDMQEEPGSDRMLLHFGAVDQECKVFVNGIKVGEHAGGYLPFVLDITEALRMGENELCLKVKDATEYRPYPRGKQRLDREGLLHEIFYQAQSGIWKTVWMERVPKVSVKKAVFRYSKEKDAVLLKVTSSDGKACPFRAEVQLPDGSFQSFDGRTGTVCTIHLEHWEYWSPEHPHLYPVRILCGEDIVESYFAVRTVEKQRDENGIFRVFLNDAPIFLNGILEQGYWPESLMTAPSDQALIDELLFLKRCGYNTVRCHIKVEEERFYYHCDRLGILVIQDMPNGGGSYDMFFQAYVPTLLWNLVRNLPDHNYARFARTDFAGRREFSLELAGMIELLEGHPSIIMWVPFNEGWGQFDASRFSKLVKRKDPARLVNEACGWFDQRGGDLYSIHNYYRRLRVSPKKDRIVMVTEYGGIGCSLETDSEYENGFGYQRASSGEEIFRRYRKLIKRDIEPNLKRGLSGTVYTQISDVEGEINGLLSWDRKVEKTDPDRLLTLHEDLYRTFDAVCKRKGKK